MNWWRTLAIAVLTATIASAQPAFKPLELLWTQRFYGHADSITATALSSDKTRLVSSDADGQVIVWDAQTGQALLSWSDVSEVTDLAFGFGDASIVASSDDGSIRTWNATSGELQTSWKLTTSDAAAFKLSPDGELIALSLSGSGKIEVCAVQSGKCVPMRLPATAYEFSPDSRTLFAMQNNLVSALDALDGRIIWQSIAPSTPENADVSFGSSFALSPDGKRLLVTASDTLRLLDASTGVVIRILETKRASLALRWNDDGSQFATRQRANLIQVWNAQTLEPVLEVDGDHLLEFGDDRLTTLWEDTLIQWDAVTGAERDYVRTDATYRLNILNRSSVLTISADTQLELTDAGSLKTQIFAGSFEPHAVSLSPDGRSYALAATSDLTRGFELSSNLELRHFGKSTNVQESAYSPDGKLLAMTTAANPKNARETDYNAVSIWRVSDGQLVTRLSGSEADKGQRVGRNFEIAGLRGFSRCLAWSPDGQRLAVGYQARAIGIWNVTTGKLEQRLLGHSNWVLSVAWRPDGKQLVSGSGDGTVRFWTPQRSALGLTQKTTAQFVRSVAYSPDGRTVASSSSDGSVTLWDASSAQVVRHLTGHRAASTSVAWSPDGQQVVSGSRDRSVKIWAKTGELLQSIANLGGTVLDVDISSDGQRLVVVTRGNSVRTWGHADGSSSFGSGK